MVRRNPKRAQIGYRETIRLPSELSKVTHHLVGDQQCDSVQSSRDCSLRRFAEGASESGRQNNNASGAEVCGVENWRVGSDCAIDEMVFADANRWKRCWDRGAGEECLD